MDSIDFEDGRKSKSGSKKKINREQEEEIKIFVNQSLIKDVKEVQNRDKR